MGLWPTPPSGDGDAAAPMSVLGVCDFPGSAARLCEEESSSSAKFAGLLSALLREHLSLEDRLAALAQENLELRRLAPDAADAPLRVDRVEDQLPTRREIKELFNLGITWSDDVADEEKPSERTDEDTEESALRHEAVMTSQRFDRLANIVVNSENRRRSSQIAESIVQPLVVRVVKLHKWFERVDHHATGILTRRQLSNMYKRVNGITAALPQAALDSLLSCLASDDVMDHVLDSDAREMCTFLEEDMQTPHGELSFLRLNARTLTSEDSTRSGMDFTGFATLIIWDGLQDRVPVELHHVAASLRDALIKHSADLLVAHHAHLKVSDPEDMKQAPFSSIALDAISGFVITANAISIGVGVDCHDSVEVDILELCFTAYFVFELIFKLYLYGCRRFCSGPERGWNLVDVTTVSLSLLDAAIFVSQQSSTNSPLEGAGSSAFLRMARLALLTRLFRLLRVLRLRAFKELTLMVKGVVAGMRTLFWAIVMLLLFVYTSAVLMRQTVGVDRVQLDDDYGTVLFSDMVWSMFMIFRILMQDGALPDGTPVAGRMYEVYGATFMIPYMLCLLFATFGIFNLMTALFVENVLEAAKRKRQLSDVQERVRVAQKLRELVLKFTGQSAIEEQRVFTFAFRRWGLSNPFAVDHSDSTAADVAFHRFTPTKCELEMDTRITRQMFLETIRDPEVDNLLNDLEVQVSDRAELFDVLDADGSGTLDVAELISGLMKLRSGGEDKSDTIATVLGVRSIQVRIRAIEESVLALATRAGIPAGHARSQDSQLLGSIAG